ncbi:fatty acid desaturase [Phormidium tenue FACHB-886]|nr:fatty acid desaturase [Phormidium tenue FACHB-886]
MNLVISTLQSKRATKVIQTKPTFKGLLIALTLLGLWASSLIYLFSLHLSSIQLVWIPVAVVVQAFLFTGLFVTAHDAMHRSVFPQNVKVNDAIGAVALFVYAFLSYQKMFEKHSLHHRYPASALDPDFHANSSQKPWLWYFSFMKRYWGWTQFFGFTVVFSGIKYLFHVPNVNLILFWIVPLVLSSIQLFYFGTFLTHREPDGGYHHPHRTQSSNFSFFLSFVTCYHFGYHEEHHEYPYVSWWRLPTVRKQRLSDPNLENSALKSLEDTPISKDAAPVATLSR